MIPGVWWEILEGDKEQEKGRDSGGFWERKRGNIGRGGNELIFGNPVGFSRQEVFRGAFLWFQMTLVFLCGLPSIY